MSNLIKPYVISVWEDKLIDGQLTEVRLGIIGANDMLTESRVLEPNLIRNSNGTKKLTFKMYKKYIDTITGEKVDNPFSDWLIAERKVKLEYEDKWYDFVVKDVIETSTDYLYQYSLEDALVQELSKNGFGVTFDAELMNNMGDVRELATATLQETDWSVDSEIFVQTVDEALIYVEVPAGTKAKHILDQSGDNLGVGVIIEDDDYEFVEASTVLAFYSCCKNKPHRFQFIYSANGYDSGPNGYEIARKDDRTINQKNCQYFIDFENPDEDYDAPGENLNDAEELNLWLPKNFRIGVPGINRDAHGNLTHNDDSTLSSWYRGKRYGFAQQSVYVPLLERYCQKFERNETIPLTDSNFKLHQDGGGSISIKVLTKDENQNIVGLSGSKRANWSGYKIDIDYSSAHTYLLSYKLKVNQGTLYTIGGHNASFYTEMEVRHDDKTYKTSSSYVDFGNNGLAVGQTIEVFVRYNKFVPETTDWSPYIFIQPNRGRADEVWFTISELSLKYGEDYLGYTESEFVSPTLIQNCINNYNFESTGGWTATSSTKTSSVDRPKVENAYGRFENSTFSTITEDFLSGSYTEGKTYTPYMKMEFYNNQQFVLNSGIRDNRTMIQNMPAGEEWVLDYKIVDANGNDANNKFDFSLGEYIYNTNSGGYNPRDGFITFSGKQTGTSRKIFTVNNTSYDKETFKKNSKVYLKIAPNSNSGIPDSTQKVNENPIGYKFYIEKIALYRKTIGADGEIIIPDLEEQNTTAETFAETGTIEHKYRYFSDWLVDSNNPNSIKEKEKLVTEVKSTLTYETYTPVYNEGAKKIRSITAKESNYFNILQTIAETFEAWLDLEIEREADGVIKSKKVKFKNYLGNENYANFRYGVNLKDIQRTTSSKNIVTKLIVKQNSNELAENGFCTIQRAGANPTGENYIYDFQYYQNMGIMDTKDFLDTVYYIDGAQGKDGELWDGYVTTDNTYNLNGYYPRIKKINDAILPINEELIGLNADLLEKKARLEVEEATYEASITGIEQVREDFVALTGIYPEEAQSGAIDSVSLPGENAVVPKEDWWAVDTSVNGNGYNQGISLSNNVVSVAIKTTSQRDEERGFEVKVSQGATTHNSYTKSYKFTKSSEWAGLYIENKWEEDREYVLTYEIEATEGTLLNVGCHNSHFSTDFSIEVKDRQGNVVVFSTYDIASSSNLAIGTKYFVTVKGKRKSPENTPQDPNLWIQPNRGKTDSVTCIVSNIQLYKVLTGSETASAKDREAHFCLNVNVGVGANTITRTYEMTATIPSNHTTGISIEQQITAIDLSRNDVQKYLTEYTAYYEKRESSNTQKEALKISIANKEASIKAKENRRKDLLEYKKQLNYLFFKKYSRFIQEGTWISEEYVDDDKYFADSQSVLYNSCYPQVGYAINVIALSSLPGYEHFVYGLGDKTNVIDEEFFGPGYQEEVIITEIAENLDDPSKNTIKVQNFKNQFQDLFQKITATVQQTQYNVGSYEKGAALVEANLAKQNEFITNAINGAQTYLNHGQTVKTGPDGITITDDSDKQNQLRLVGGAILFSTTDENTQEQTWMTGVTKDGISANLITAGRLDAGVVQIMSGNEPVFRWDAYGISAYDALWTKTSDISTISGINTKKFVRFDKNGIYGINNATGVDGANWHPDSIEKIDEKATFALTWEGLKVTGQNGTVARIGRTSDNIINIIKNVSSEEGENETTTETPVFTVSTDGDVLVDGAIYARSGQIGPMTIEAVTSKASKNLIGKYNKHLDGNYFSDIVSISNSQSGYGYYFDLDNSPFVGAFKIDGLQQNSKYTFSFEAWAEGQGVDIKEEQISVIGDFYQPGSKEAIAKQECGVLTESKQRYYGTLQLTNPPINNKITLFRLYPNKDSLPVEVYITDIKLEYGDAATEWSPSDEELPNAPMKANVSNNFSWKFSPTEGMYMWNGDQNSSAVFSVTSEGLYMNGNGTFTGVVTADKGKIGGWNTTETGFSKTTEQKIIYDPLLAQYSGGNTFVICYQGNIYTDPLNYIAEYQYLVDKIRSIQVYDIWNGSDTIYPISYDDYNKDFYIDGYNWEKVLFRAYNGKGWINQESDETFYQFIERCTHNYDSNYIILGTEYNNEPYKNPNTGQIFEYNEFFGDNYYYIYDKGYSKNELFETGKEVFSFNGKGAVCQMTNNNPIVTSINSMNTLELYGYINDGGTIRLTHNPSEGLTLLRPNGKGAKLNNFLLDITNIRTDILSSNNLSFSLQNSTLKLQNNSVEFPDYIKINSNPGSSQIECRNGLFIDADRVDFRFTHPAAFSVDRGYGFLMSILQKTYQDFQRTCVNLKPTNYGGVNQTGNIVLGDPEGYHLVILSGNTYNNGVYIYKGNEMVKLLYQRKQEN